MSFIRTHRQRTPHLVHGVDQVIYTTAMIYNLLSLDIGGDNKFDRWDDCLFNNISI